MALSRARARLNWVSQGQPCGRCKVRRRAERVIRPAREKNRRRRVEDPIVQFVTALRHLEILGQVLKNFPGSLEALAKLDITRECFHLGLRSLSVVLQLVRSGQSEILNEMSHEIRLRHPDMATWEVGNRARESLIGIVHMLSYGLTRRVAKAVGSRDLGHLGGRQYL